MRLGTKTVTDKKEEKEHNIHVTKNSLVEITNTNSCK